MVTRKRGISPDLLIHPGETISDILEERDITQKELAQRSGVSEAFLSDVIHGKKDISKGLAMGLEYALGIPRSFWLNLQANYDADLLCFQEEESIDEEEKQVLASLHEIVEYFKQKASIPLDATPTQTIIYLRKKLQISNLVSLKTLVPAGEFRMSSHGKVDPYVLGAWLCMCKVIGEQRQLENTFDPSKINQLVQEIKRIMCSTRGDPQKPLISLFSNYGIDFNIVHNFRGAPVQGYIAKKEDGTYQMTVTIRGAYADMFWFSVFHELGHIANGDLNKPGAFIDPDSAENKKEEAADMFARKALIDEEDYQRFLAIGSHNYAAIKEFAQEQNIPAYIVIGRLQKEGIIPWTWFAKYKIKYKWATA